MFELDPLAVEASFVPVGGAVVVVTTHAALDVAPDVSVVCPTSQSLQALAAFAPIAEDHVPMKQV